MPKFLDQNETANNREAESNLQAQPFNGTGNSNGLQIGEEPSANSAMSDQSWIALTVKIKRAAEESLNKLRAIWNSNYLAMNNKHIEGSKYNTEKYRGRSQLHRPKTRTSVKKSDAGAANALFATSDVVAIEAQNSLDEKQVASAEINKALLNYRLDRKSGKAGLPWFQVAVGAHNDVTITGLCVSKQYWEHREIDTGETETVTTVDPTTGQPQMEPVLDPVMQTPVLDETGQPQMQPITEQRKKMKVVRDRPMVRLFPAELVLRDPGADWLDQSQESAYVGLIHAMTIGDVEAMIADTQTKVSNVNFRNVSRSVLTSARIGSGSVKQSSTRDTSGQSNRLEVSTGEDEFDRIWVIEWFVRFKGREYHYWTVGSSQLLSDPIPLEQAYPEFMGERPIVIGVGNIEPHKVDPMSMVQSILPLQIEMDELVNMRLDGVKDTLRPLAFIKKGRNIDVQAIQRRSGDSAIYVTDKDDVTFDRPGQISSESYMEMNYLNADFDDSTGQFNGGSVSTNRSLNETVGGMQLLNSSANVVGDFDLRVWIETWVEPVLRQLVALEQFYEDDKIILALCGQKAKLYQKYGINEIDDELLTREVSISVNAGIGNADPMVKLDKFLKVAGAAGTLLGPTIQSRAKQDEIVNEIFGAAGFRDAAERFFKPEDGSADPGMQQAQQQMQQMQQEMQKLQQQVADKQAGLDNAIEIKRIDSATQLVIQYLQGQMASTAAQQKSVIDATHTGLAHAHAITTTGLTNAAKQSPSQTDAQGPQAPQQNQVEQDLGTFADQFITQMDPGIGQAAQPPQAAQAQPPAPQGMEMMQAILSHLDQNSQAVMDMVKQAVQPNELIAQALQSLATAHMTPKKAQKAADGSITIGPMTTALQ